MQTKYTSKLFKEGENKEIYLNEKKRRKFQKKTKEILQEILQKKILQKKTLLKKKYHFNRQVSSSKQKCQRRKNNIENIDIMKRFSWIDIERFDKRKNNVTKKMKRKTKKC